MNGSTSMESKYLNINRNQMEVREPLNLENRPSHRQLTPLRAFRGILCLVMLISTAFMMIVYCAPVTALLLRLFSVHYSRKYTSFLFAAWLSLWPFLFEKINKTKVVFSGETLPMKNRVLLFSNHRTEVDWMYLWDLALRKGHLGSLKYILKSSLMKLPIFGWSFQIMEFIAVERKWEIDESIMRKKLLSFKDPQDPLWLVVFPEGTDYTEKKCIKSQQFASENGLPILENVLIPKTKGICACLESLRDSLDAVYDITIAYKNRCPSLIDNLFGVDPSEVHIHAQQLKLNEIPTSEKEVAKWLIERFTLKDQLLSDFTTLGYFPNQGTEGELSTLACLVRCLAVTFITSYFMYLTLFSSIWFKIYVAFSCAYLSFATYFNVLPSPLYNCAKASLCGKSKNM